MKLRLTDASIRQLNVFKCVVENSGFGAAQASLNTSAAAISIQMKELEDQLGFKLCERGRKGFKLTDDGIAVYEATKKLTRSFDNFNQEIATISDSLSGSIRIGLQDNLSTCETFMFSEAITKFNQKKNNVEFCIEEVPSSEQEIRTLEGRYNLSIGVFSQRIPGLSYQYLFDDPITMYCGKGHPLFDTPESKIKLKDLQKESHVGTHPLLDMIGGKKFFSQEPDALAESMDAVCLLLLSGNYVGLLPDAMASYWVERGQMKALLPRKTGDTVKFHMITKRGASLPYAVKEFIQDLLDCHETVLTS
jgi:DNA-binding transcriptional LysR family regulator